MDITPWASICLLQFKNTKAQQINAKQEKLLNLVDTTPWANISLLQTKNTKTQHINAKKENYEILWILRYGPTLVAERESNQVIKKGLFNW